MRAIIKFTKEENIRYISHLDILRMFQRAVKRAELPVSYSCGFNPHMLIGFACALPTGALSMAEYAEIRLDRELDCGMIKDRLNAVMPKGCRILGVKEIAEGYPSLMAVVSRAEYSIEITDRSADGLIAELVAAAAAASEITVNKKTKKGVKPTDIRGMIHNLDYSEGAIHCVLDAGNSVNLRPDTLMEYFSGGLECFPEYRIIRTAMYIAQSGEIIDAFSAGGDSFD